MFMRPLRYILGSCTFFYDLVNVHVPKDRGTNAHQGYGFVEFRSEEDADYAIYVLNMIKLYGKAIRVNKASQDKKSVDVGANLFIGNLDPERTFVLLFISNLVASTVPWVFTVAASTTDSGIISKVVLGNGTIIAFLVQVHHSSETCKTQLHKVHPVTSHSKFRLRALGLTLRVLACRSIDR